MIHEDDELARWQQQWRAQPGVPIDLRRRVERDIHARRLAMLGSIAVTIVMGGGTTLWALQSGRPQAWTLISIVWIFIAVAWALTAHVERRQGPWRPLQETTGAFLEYAIQSRRARRHAIEASAILYVVFFVVVLAVRFRAAAVPDLWSYFTSARVLTLLMVSAALAVAAVYHHRQLYRELRNLETVREALDGKDP